MDEGSRTVCKSTQGPLGSFWQTQEHNLVRSWVNSWLSQAGRTLGYRKEEGACLLSSLLSMRSWVWLADVRAEKVRKWLMYSSGRFLRSLSEMVRVFPVPVGPMHSTWENGDHVFKILTRSGTQQGLPPQQCGRSATPRLGSWCG